jgi:ceramide glucosyltransferase
MVARLVLGMRFALGATLALRARDLARIGGFAAVADYLADDYQLGRRIAECGQRVHLSSYVLQSVLGATTFVEQWQREVRWAHCSRVSRPWGYLGLLLSFSTPLSVLLVAASPMAIAAWLILGGSIFLRWLLAWSITFYSGDREVRHWLFWLPLRDMLSALVWLAGLLGRRRVVWRGETYRLDDEGRLQPLPLCQAGGSISMLRWLVRALDAVLRRLYRRQAGRATFLE